ncbi:carbon-nitrogen hydrolase family protein [Marimonas arenosa]|uniref:Carbon-nitrogen hydrolase family protein n=1 Tax=Marimonas arenosa TaxID=1795305 RepID=A0AAE3WB48_9RHOB|nr:carbon-nitrogen hydrolase family protein [Marimonas arenosa]MDQ2089369.1 carbon-nitrogen hydrolase family protein [Marimonas arenosa]
MTREHPERSPGITEPLLLFFIGFGLFMFCRRSDFLPLIPATIIIAPIFILRFSRILPGGRAALLTALGFVLAINISLWGIFDMSDPLTGVAFNVVRSSLIGLLYAVPYWIDRAITPRLGDGLHTTLVFPVAATAIMFLATLEGPLDGTQAKNIYGIGPLPILQLYALTGLWGFVFLWSWLAALINFAWARGYALRPSLAALLLFAVPALALYGFGANRLATAPDVPQVRLASAVMAAGDIHPVSMEAIYETRKTVPLEQTLAVIEAMTAEAVAEGAKIVTFPEFALLVTEEERAIVETRAGRIAADNGIWLSLPYAWMADEGRGENRHLLIDDTGAIRIDHKKRYLFGYGPIGEAGAFSKGPGTVQTVDSPYGRISVAICRDLSFPQMIRQAGAAGADIMLTGSHDFPSGIVMNDPFRSVENGMTHVRTTFNGISYAMDPYGRLLSERDNGEGRSAIMYVDIPTRGTRTLYARFGDWLGWGSVGLTVLFGTTAILRRKRGNVVADT